jgi:hypothetical protein
LPRSLKVDWKAIRDRWESGVSAKIIGQEFNVKQDTILRRAHRGSWPKAGKTVTHAVRSKVTSLVNKAANRAIAKITPKVDAAVAEWVDRSLTTAARGVQRVSERLEDAQCPKDLLATASALERFDLVGRRSLGLDREAQPTVAVQVNVLGAASLACGVDPAPDSPPDTTIDVTPA